MFDVDGERTAETDDSKPVHWTEQSIAESASRHWDNEPERRYTYKPVSDIEDDSYDENWTLRSQTLGNTVCPVVVRASFVELVRLMRNQRAITDIFRQFGSIDVDKLKYPFPDTGLVTDGRFYSIPSMNLSIKTAADVNRVPVDIAVTMPDGRVLRPMNYPTPRRGMAHASTLNDRAMRDLPSVLLHSEKTIEGMARDLAIMYPQEEGQEAEGDAQIVRRPEKPQDIAIQNVNYVEWMMGYPSDWTRVKHFDRSNGKKTAASAADTGGEWDDDDDDEDACITQDGGGSRKSRSGATKRQTLNAPPSDVKYKPNGMHLLMRESKGLDVRAVSLRWRALSDAERCEYSRRARELDDPNAFLTSRAC
jgi:hypothetical protein